MKKLFLLLTTFTILFSCQDKQISDSEIVSKLILKYPELRNSNKSDYKLKRTVKIKNDSIGINLFEDLNNTRGNKIIILYNFNNEKYAIPLFTNYYSKYWSFENEEATFKNKSYNSLFEKEFITAINKLNLNDSSGIGNSIINEIMYSLLHFQIVTEFDEKSSRFSEQILTDCDYYEKEEDFEIRTNLNLKELFKGIRKGEYIFEYNAFYDRINDRIFQIEFPLRWKSSLKKLNMKIYRLGRCVESFSCASN